VTTADPGAVIEAGPARPAGAAARFGRLRTLVETETGLQAERWFLWAPVAAGAGAAVHIGSSAEPSLAFAAVVAIVAVGLAVAAAGWGRSRLLLVLAALLAFGACGFAGSTLRTRLVAAPVVPAGLPPPMVEGWVVDVDAASADRPRLLIAPTWIQGLPDDARPRRIRLTLRDHGLIGPGRAIRVRALLNPPPPPASPGAYDFARDAWFEQIGGSGLALGRPLVVSLARPAPALRLGMAINAARWSLARRLVDRMGPETGGLAAALVTGHQAWLAEADIEAMRASGLAHILSISGIHMAIVGGFVFAAVRLGLAAWPWAALRVPGKKWAAAGAMSAVLVYLLVSGAPPPAERAAITASVAFLAVLLDRRALTLHSLAIAALVVLALQPEAVAQPGFQMSFAATAALLAMAEAWPRPTREISVPWPILAWQRLGVWLGAAFMISFVAGLATGPFAIQHFNRVTLWGLPANLATEALSSLVVLPALAVGAVLELAGWGGGPLSLAHWGLQATTAMARLFAGLPGAVMVVASAPEWTLPVAFLGLLFVCLWKGRLRWVGLPFFAAVSLAPRPPTPDLWIAAEGANAAVRAGREAVVLRPQSQAFASELWTRRRGLVPPADPAARAEALFDCGRDACIARPAAPVRLAAWRRRIPPTPQALARLCAGAEVVILRTGTAPAGSCGGALVLDQPALARGGAAELYRTPRGWRVVWAQDLRGDRPWTRAGGGVDEG
jgi:competence protein ComEC